MIGKPIFKLGVLVFVVAVIAVGAVFGLMSDVGLRASTAPDAPSFPVWPEFTMVYETKGDVIKVGDNDSVHTNEVHQLDYVSVSDWTDTVIEAPIFVTKGGDFSTVGTVRKLKGSTLTETESLITDPYVTTLEDNETYAPGRIMGPFPIEETDRQFTLVITDSRVCFLDQCTDNSHGLSYARPGGTEVVFLDDARGIPLSVGGVFRVRELLINGTKQEYRPGRE